MSLPKITHPVFKVKVPSTKKEITLRPFTVREEKIILMLKDSENLHEIVDMIKQIISNCAMDKLDVNSLALFDIEYLFIKLRAKSVGEELELFYNDGEKKIPFTVNLDKVEVKFDSEHKKKFLIAGDLGVTMRYPNFETMLKYEKVVTKEEPETEQFMIDLFIDCIENIYDDKKVYTEFTKEELNEFILSLPVNSVEGISKFFETMPTLEHQVTFKKSDKTDVTVVLKGLKDFFLF